MHVPQALELRSTVFRGLEEQRYMRLHLILLPRLFRTINEQDVHDVLLAVSRRFATCRAHLGDERCEVYPLRALESLNPLQLIFRRRCGRHLHSALQDAGAFCFAQVDAPPQGRADVLTFFVC